MYGLRTWWVDAVGTRLLSLHRLVPALAAGAAAGDRDGAGLDRLDAARPAPGRPPAGCWLGEQKRGHRRQTPLDRRRHRRRAGWPRCRIGARLDQTGGFFGAGTLLLIARAVLRIRLAAARAVCRYRRPGHARPAQRRLSARTQRAVHRADRVGHVPDRFARCFSTRRRVRRHGWISADGRIGTAADPRSEHAQRAARPEHPAAAGSRSS